MLLLAALPKLTWQVEFERALTNYQLLPSGLVPAVARWLPRLELLCALALFAGVLLAPVATAVAILLTVFSAAMAVNLVRGRRIDCGCGGSVAPRQIGWRLVISDLALAAMAAWVAIVRPTTLAAAPVVGSTQPQPITSGDALAVVIIAQLAVVARILVSAWLASRSSVRRAQVLDRRSGR